MRKFTTLFLLALAMTIGASQAFAAQAGASNGIGSVDKPDPRGRTEPTESNVSSDKAGDPFLATSRCPNDLRCPPRKPKVIITVKKETEDCGCVHKVMRVNGRFMPFIDCYQSISVNGREQLRYCRKDD